MIRKCGFPEMLQTMLASGFRKPMSVTLHPDDYADVVRYDNGRAERSPFSVPNEFMGVKLTVSLRTEPGQWSFGYEGEDEQE